MRRATLLLLCLAGCSATTKGSTRPDEPPAAAMLSEEWPREIRQGADVLTIYQPQLESWNGHRLVGQAAVSMRSGAAEPVFGVMWFTARTTVNKTARLVTLEDLTVVKASFPSAPDKVEAYTRRLRVEVAAAPKLIALDRLEAELGILNAARKGEELALRNDPPRILFFSVPAVVIHIDGTPVYQPVRGTGLLRVVNTRPLLLRDAAGMLSLRILGGWLAAPAPGGPWAPAQPTAELATALRQAAASGNVDLLETAEKAGKAPEIVIATTPTELIVTEGAPRWTPIGGGTRLHYVENTTGHVFKHLGDACIYTLISGRWFRAATMSGPWTFVPGVNLPADFAGIPDDSPKENVKAAVPGTPQAEEALIANGIPQTAKVDVAKTQIAAPVFDGAPRLHTIEGTQLQLVANSSIPVIVVGPRAYYAVDRGVWFVASSLEGPWLVATSVPAAIYAIPPSSAVHFVTYVRVYDATPEVVYVGYTPGYWGTCVSGGVVVYGTGYVHTAWVGTVWYGAPATYGYGASVTYTPWTGWTYGVGFGWSSAAPYYGGWAATTGSVYIHRNSTSVVARSSGGYNAWSGNAWTARAGASYNSRTGVAAAGRQVTAGNVSTGRSVTAGRGVVYDPASGQATSAAGVHGNDAGAARVGGDVYAGKDGNVYKHGSDGWQQYQNGSWQAVQDPQRTGSLDRQRSARATGEGRVQSFQRANPSGAGSRPSLGRRR